MKRKRTKNRKAGLGWIPEAIGTGLLLLLLDITLESWLPESVVAAIIVTILLVSTSVSLFRPHLKSPRFWGVAAALLVAHSVVMVVGVRNGIVTLRLGSLLMLLGGELLVIATIVNWTMVRGSLPPNRKLPINPLITSNRGHAARSAACSVNSAI